MKALFTGVLAPPGSTLYAEVIFIDETAGNQVVDRQVLNLTTRLQGANLSGASSMANVIQGAILDYAGTQAYVMNAADVLQGI